MKNQARVERYGNTDKQVSYIGDVGSDIKQFSAVGTKNVHFPFSITGYYTVGTLVRDDYSLKNVRLLNIVSLIG